MFSRRTTWNLEKNAFTRALEERQRSGDPILDLSLSNPTEAGWAPGWDTIAPTLNHPESAHYDPQPRGLLRARQAICDYYRDLDVVVRPEQLFLTTSTSEAYTFLFRLLCDPGDEVLIPAPSYPLFEFLADIQDVQLRPYELIYDHGWQVDFHSLQQAISARTRAIILVNPNNPTGSYIKKNEREKLNRICSQGELALIADEVFFDFNLSDERFDSFAGNREALTFSLSGLSKVAGLPQMKVAWMVASGPEELVCVAADRLEVLGDTYLSMNAPIQHAVPELLESRVTFQQRLMARLRSNLAELDRQLLSQKVCSRLAVEGGWYAILRVPVTQSDEELAISLLAKEGVLVHPGHFFNFLSEGYLVLSLMTEEATFKEGVSRLLRFVERRG